MHTQFCVHVLKYYVINNRYIYIFNMRSVHSCVCLYSGQNEFNLLFILYLHVIYENILAGNVHEHCMK